MNKGGNYDVEMTGWIPNCGIIRCKVKGRMEKGGHYDVQIKRMDGWIREGIMMWK